MKLVWKDFLRVPSKLEGAILKQEKFSLPAKEFDVYETEFITDDGYKATIAYIEGGMRNGIRYTFAILDNRIGHASYGWQEGWKLPVPVRGDMENIRYDIPEIDKVLYSLSRARVELLPTVNLVPRFRENEDEGRYQHEDGWYTNSTFAIPRYVPPALKEQGVDRVWKIAEGMYVLCRDKSYKLIPYKEWDELTKEER